jgi:hypothetical protein
VDTLPPNMTLVGEATEFIRVGGDTELANGTTSLYQDGGVAFTDLHDWPDRAPSSPQTVEDVGSLAEVSDKPVPGVIYRTGLREAQGIVASGSATPAAAAGTVRFPVAGTFMVNYTVFDESKNMGTIARLLVVQPAAESASTSTEVIAGSVLTVLAACIIG